MNDIERLIAELAVRYSQCPQMHQAEPSTPEILRTILRMMHALEAQRDAASERVRLLTAPAAIYEVDGHRDPSAPGGSERAG